MNKTELLKGLHVPSNFDFIMETMVRIMETKMNYSTDTITFSSQDIAKNYFLSKLGDKKNEVFCGLFLDNNNKIIKFEELFYGTINQAQVYPRVVAQKCLEYNAAAIILAHNHPSGNIAASGSDKLITTKLIDTLDLIDVRVLDHFIVGVNDITSMAQIGLM